MENPYQSPDVPADSAVSVDPFHRRRGLVHHVRVVAILMIVQGVLELLAAGVFGTFAVLMPTMFQQMENQPQLQDNPALWVMPLIYGVMAAAALAASVLHLAAGLRNYQFRGRTLGIVALACGALTVLTCYCLPTAAALSIYGLIVYLNPEASDAFRMSEAGAPVAQIFDTFQG